MIGKVHEYNARCPGVPERLIDNPNDQGGRYRQQSLQQHHAQAYPPKEIGAGTGKIQSYQDVKRLIEKFPKDARKRGGGAEFQQTYIVDSDEEFRAVEQKLIHGLKSDRTISTPRGEIKMYKLPDGTDVKVKEGSRSGGRTIEIVPTHSSDDALKVHIKRGK